MESRQQRLLRALWGNGPLSRWELHEQTGLSPNAVGTLADSLIRNGIVRECPPESARMGRPRVPLEIDPSNRHILGVALVPGRVEIARLSLQGKVLDNLFNSDVILPSELISVAARMLKQHINDKTLGVGVSVTGFIDASTQSVLLSSALPGLPAISLSEIFEASGGLPAVLGNDMHALAAKWLLTHHAEKHQDVLLVRFIDGRLGSMMLLDGRPNRGSATGANELGHTRYFVETDRCFCGQIGCLERIVSTPFLTRLDRERGVLPNKLSTLDLEERVRLFQAGGADPSVDTVIKYLSNALANAINFARPHRLVLVSPLTRNAHFTDALTRQTNSLVLNGLSDVIQIQCWDQPSEGSAEHAGWLGMAEWLYGGWNRNESADILRKRQRLPVKSVASQAEPAL